MRRNLPLLAGLVGVSLLGSCIERTSGTQPFGPPEGTGETVLDMRGTWEMADVQLLASSGGVSSLLEPSAQTGLVPPQDGAVVVIDANGFLTGNGLSMRPRPDEEGLQRYHNSQNGRVALYDWISQTHPDVADGGRLELRIAAGSVPDGTMVGVLFFDRAGAFLPRDALRTALFRFRLVRVP